MNWMMKCVNGTDFANSRFPVTEKELQILCDSLGTPNISKTVITIHTVHNDERLNALLAGKTVNLDELNYLTKRLDSFGDGEMNTFCAVAKGQKLSTMKDMINLTFNTQCYSLVDDFSDFESLGKSIYLNSVGSASSEKLKSFDGKAYLEKIMAEHPHPLVTPYGLVYENGNQPQQLYNGKTFPAYWYEPNPITLSISTAEDTEYLYLPAEKSEMDKALARLGIEDITIATVKVAEHSLPQNIAAMVLQNIDDFNVVNAFAKIFDEMGHSELKSLSELMGFTKITTAEQLRTLAGCMYEFESFPCIQNAEQYGRYMICESGHFEYDENLESYIDFKAYGKHKCSYESGAFTDKGYLLYHGYHQKMQNILSQTLGLKIKETYEPQKLKLYMPLKAITYYDENNYGDLYQVDFEIEVSPGELAEYEDEIHSAILDRRLEDEKRGMMDYYEGHDTVNAKVQKYVFDVEEVHGELMGVAVLTLNTSLDAAELEKIKQEISSQAADGFGEGFEQQEINCGGKEICVSLWNTKDWSLQTAQELGITQPMQGMTMA